MLALLCVPLALTLEPLAALPRQVPAEDFPQASCEGLRMDRRGVAYLATSGYASWMAEVALVILVIETVPQAPRVLPHLLIATFAICAFLFLYVRNVFAGVREIFWLWGPFTVLSSRSCLPS